MVECIRFDDDLEAVDEGQFDVKKWHASRAASLDRVRVALVATAGDMPRIVVADDNAQYRSMRYILFKVARDAACAFASVFVATEVDEAVRRNAVRAAADRVPEATIRRMASQLEPPDAAKHVWEAHSVTVDGMSEDDAGLDAVWRTLDAALAAGVAPKAEEPTERAERVRMAQAVTAASTTHNLDLTMRHLVRTLASSDDVQALDKPGRTRVTAALARARKAAHATKLDDLDAAIAAFATELRRALVQGQPPPEMAILESLAQIAEGFVIR